MNKNQGKLFVIDGIDGAGKTTQINLLSRWLKEKEITFEVINFPRYGQNKYAKQIKKYLDGEMGSKSKIDPYKIARFYASDRLLAKFRMKKWLQDKKLVIANRYVSSNKAHMGVNLPPDEREKFFKWLDNLEYKKNGIPKEDLTILLNVDPKIGQKNVLGKHNPDIHERNLEHLNEANKIYLELAGNEKNWIVVDCMDNGRMKAKQEIQRDIVKIIINMVLSKR